MIKIHINDDFNLDRIADSGQCFRWEKMTPDTYRIIYRGYCLEIQSLGGGRFLLSCEEEEYRNVWVEYFDFEENYRGIRERILENEDPFLFRACEYGKGIRILRQDAWEMLITSIITQNRNIPAIKKSIEMLCRSAGHKSVDFRGRPFFLFPSPEDILAMGGDTLSGCKLGYRCRYVRAAAEAVAEGKLDLERLKGVTVEEALKELITVYGVGSKVASCVALFGLHQTDAFPVDVWIQRILEQEYNNNYPMELYRPYNGIYQQYMFYYYREKAALEKKSEKSGT